MSESQRPRGLGAAARVTALASSVMDLHVRIALQEMDREKRRLISGGIFLALGGILMVFALAAIHIFLILWVQKSTELNLWCVKTDAIDVGIIIAKEVPTARCIIY